MSLTTGTRLGPYEVLSPLGAGGMGEVYRARDTKLHRDVALKVLPESLADDPERRARFEREAQVLASLNHPNIAQIHGFEDSGDVRALVMELVEGPTLADRIAEGALPVVEALPIATQIAEALAAAHEVGVIHRDLKPANIKVRTDGTVKVLDFGLAKALDPMASGNASATMSPTMSLQATQAGVILGTAAYMAPEQAKGKPVDKRADIWAFGCVLYEMLAGRRPFEGDDVSDVFASVLAREPKLDALPSEVPHHIRTLIARCLAKDRKQRIPDISVALYIINNESGATPAPVTAAPAAPVPKVRLLSIGVGLGSLGGVLLTALAAWILLRPASQPSPDVTRFTIVPPPNQPLSIRNLDRDIAISPDGRQIAYRVGGGAGRLAVRSLDRLDPQIFEGIFDPRMPFFSPDGRWIGFVQNNIELKKVSITGGPAITICRLPHSGPRGASWTEDNTIIFATNNPEGGLLTVPAGGGDPKALTRPDVAQRELGHLFPWALPDNRGVLFTIGAASLENTQVAVLDLETGQRKTIIRGGTSAAYTESGHIVYAAGGALRAVRFDLERLETVGDPFPVVEQVSVAATGAANFAVSRRGTLVYVPHGAASARRQLTWVDRQGREEPIKAPARAYSAPRLSPDGSRIALEVREQENDVWIWDVARETLTRLTFDPSVDLTPAWTPDGRRIIFGSTRAGGMNLFWHAADGTGTSHVVTTGPNLRFPNSITPDGTRAIGQEMGSSDDVVQWRLDFNETRTAGSAQTGGAPSEPLMRTSFSEMNAEVSPDQRYLAYQSNESGPDEIYIRPYPNVNEGRWQVSMGGGSRPVWSRSGRELFYLDASNTLMSVQVQATTASFSRGTPAKVFETKYATPGNARSYDVSSDGKRFLMLKEASADNTAPAGLVVVQHWLEELKRLVPEK